MIIAVSGKARSGKGEFASIAVREYGFEQISFAGALKREVQEFLDSHGLKLEARYFYGENKDKEERIEIDERAFDLEGEDKFFRDYLLLYGKRVGNSSIWNITTRSLMQWWGTEYRRSQDDQYWVKKCIEACSGEGKFVIDDMRFENEADAMAEAGAFLVRVERPNNPNAVSNPDHPSETGLDGWRLWHWIIDNETTLTEYHSGVRMVIEDLLPPEELEAHLYVGVANGTCPD